MWISFSLIVLHVIKRVVFTIGSGIDLVRMGGFFCEMNEYSSVEILIALLRSLLTKYKRTSRSVQK